MLYTDLAAMFVLFILYDDGAAKFCVELFVQYDGV